MSTTWNPADILNVTLSGGNLIATGNLAGNQIAARAHGTGHSTGKWYLEYVNVNSAGGGGYGVGLLADTLSANAGGRIGIFQSGALNVPGTNGGNFGTGTTNGYTLGLAIDFTDSTAWMTRDGVNWVGYNGAGVPNPATNAFGASLSGLPAGLLYPMCAMFSTPSAATLNVGASAFAYSVPAGFTAWDSTPVPTNIFGTVIN